ncbi:MAG: PAS domain S-box protein [Rhodospirillaceae bacterium]|nr:PAS domain S-box protein [Rhodospirillales bacterium]
MEIGVFGLVLFLVALNIAYLVWHRRSSQTSLQRAESKTSAILDAAVDGIITIDKNGCIETFNAAAERIFGYGRDEVIGRNVKTLMPEPYQSEHDGYLAAYKATGKPRIIGTGREVQGRRKDGSTFPMDLAVGESRNGDRRLFAGIVRDITERKATEQRLLESEAKTRAILETAADGIITIDENGLVLSANPAAERLFGYQAAEIIGHNINMLMPEPYRSAHDGYLSRYRKTGERKIIGIGREVEGLRKDGSTFPMELGVGEAVVGGARIFTGIVRDTTERKRGEDKLRDSEAKTRAILETAADGIITIDEFGVVLTANRAAERLFLYSTEELIGRNINMLMPEPYHSAHDNYLKRHRDTGERRIIGIGREVEGRRRDGTTFPMDLAVGEASVGGKRIFTGIVRDITARKRTEEELRQSEERLRLLVDNVRDYAITWLDVDGHIASWNGGAERIYGWSAEEAIGMSTSAFYPPETKPMAQRALAKVREEGRYEDEGWRVRKDGSRLWAHVVITPLWDAGGHMRGYVRVSRDITDRMRVEEELRAAKDEAERANMAKSKFLAAASHDLRQPVQALVFFASALESKIGRSSAATVLGDMKGSLEALNVLLDALLDVSRLDAGIVTPQPTNFSLSVLIDRLMAEFGPLATDKKIALKTVPSSALVRTDPMLLGRVLQNFLTNAIRYTPRGRILIGCRRHNSVVRIQVWDTGIGIPPERLNDIFTEFYQVGNTERDRNQGLGLGLAIVARLSRLLDCKVEVRSKEGRGSMFSIDIPVVSYSSARNVAFLDTAARREEAKKGLVLVIDDEISVLKGLQMVLESWGYDVITATAEAEAVQLLDALHRPPDLIIADYSLRQGHTGAEAILHIRSQLNRSIPALLITGDTAPERLREAEAHGLNLLHKPVQPGKLRDVLAQQMHS